MTPEDHAEKMALFLVECQPFLSERKAERARELVKSYRGDLRKAREHEVAATQGSMFDDGVSPITPYQRQDTSIEAAGAIAPHAKAIRERVFQALVDKPDTDQGVSIRLSLAENTVRPRRIELERDGRVIDSGERRVLASKRKAIVWAPIARRVQGRVQA